MSNPVWPRSWDLRGMRVKTARGTIIDIPSDYDRLQAPSADFWSYGFIHEAIAYQPTEGIHSHELDIIEICPISGVFPAEWDLRGCRVRLNNGREVTIPATTDRELEGGTYELKYFTYPGPDVCQLIDRNDWPLAPFDIVAILSGPALAQTEPSAGEYELPDGSRTNDVYHAVACWRTGCLRWKARASTVARAREELREKLVQCRRERRQFRDGYERQRVENQRLLAEREHLRCALATLAEDAARMRGILGDDKEVFE